MRELNALPPYDILEIESVNLRFRQPVVGDGQPVNLTLQKGTCHFGGAHGGLTLQESYKNV